MNRTLLIAFSIATLAAVGLSVSGTGRQLPPVRALTVPPFAMTMTGFSGSGGSVRSGSAGNSYGSSSGGSYRHGK
jgi:hypothetical protein